MPPIAKEKKNNKSPVIIAPIMLVAAKVMPKRITDVKIVPNIPAKTKVSLLQQGFLSAQHKEDVNKRIPK